MVSDGTQLQKDCKMLVFTKIVIKVRLMDASHLLDVLLVRVPRLSENNMDNVSLFNEKVEF